MRLLQRGPLVLLLLAVSCSREDASVSSAESPIYGPSTVNVDDVGTGFEAAVGRLFFPGGFCSATAISRTSIVTARHCLCNVAIDPSTVFFCLPQGGSGDRCASLDGNEGFVTALSGLTVHQPWGIWDTCNGPLDYSMPGPDLMVMFLATPIPVSVLPSLPKVYLGDSLFSFALSESAAQGGLPHFFNVGFGGTTWATNVNSGPRRRGSIGPDLRYETENDEWDSIFLEGDGDDDPAAIDTGALGDSGGPLIMQPMAGGVRVGTPYVVGVFSLITTYAWDDDQHWAETGSHLQGHDGTGPVRNSDLVKKALSPDEDGDQVLDTNDNCPASACPNNAADCYNPNQDDADGDGAGDVCDRCPNVADASGFGIPGKDTDGDGRGDVCDNCPHTYAWSQADEDGDLVGDICDNCRKTPNGYASCTTSCSKGTCLKVAGQTTGHCSKQDDDSDGDGEGNACDLCDSNDDNVTFDIASNSNEDTENLLGYSKIGDVCEPVPQYVSRPNLVPFLDRNQPCPDGGAGATCANVARLFASATIGSSDGTLKTFTAPVGFRHCDCYNSAETLLQRETCLATRCAILPSDYSSPTSTYKRVSVGVAGAGVPAYPASLSASTFGSKIFNSSITDSDYYDHPDDQLEGFAEYESHRVGPTQLLSWAWKRDLTLGTINGHPAAAPIADRQTGGIFWSLAMPTTANAGRRDSSSNSRLRSTYTYFSTPLVAQPKPVNYGPIQEIGCVVADCFLVTRPGLEHVNPQDRDFFDVQRSPLRIHADLGHAVVSGDSRFSAFSADALLSGEMRASLLSGGYRWLSPVESDRVSRSIGDDTAGAYVPNAWIASSEVHTYRYDNGAFAPALVPASGAAQPGQRSGFAPLLSLIERTVYLVGGRNDYGDFLHDVWRFNLDTGVWTEMVLAGQGFDEVLDAAYVPRDQRLLVVDRSSKSGRSMVRFLELDLTAMNSKVIAEYAETGRYQRISVAAEEGGTFVLLLGIAATPQVEAFRFSVDRSAISWRGKGTYSGRLIDGGQIAGSGILAPMFANGLPMMPTITGADLATPSSGPSGF